MKSNKEDIKFLTNFQKSFKDFIENKKSKKDENNLFFSSLSPLKKINLNLAKQIYRENYFQTLKSALRDTFPICLRFLTERIFHKLTFHFILSHPPTNPFLSEYGKEFPFFLKNTVLRKSFPFLDSLAHFEWLFKKLTLTQSLERPSSLKSISVSLEKNEDEAQFRMIKNTCAFSSKFLIYSLWKELNSPKHSESINSKNNRLNQINEKNEENLLMLKKRNTNFTKTKEDVITIQKISPETFFLASNLYQSVSLSNLKKLFANEFKNKSKIDLDTVFTQSFSFLIKMKVLKIMN